MYAGKNASSANARASALGRGMLECFAHLGDTGEVEGVDTLIQGGRVLVSGNLTHADRTVQHVFFLSLKERFEKEVQEGSRRRVYQQRQIFLQSRKR